MSKIGASLRAPSLTVGFPLPPNGRDASVGGRYANAMGKITNKIELVLGSALAGWIGWAVSALLIALISEIR